MAYLAVFTVLIVCLVIHHYTWEAEAWPNEGLKPPLYQGHRGYWKSGAQENTLHSFESAGQRGLKMIEMDVRLAKDGVPVIFHDTDFKRLGASIEEHKEKTVLDLSAEELRNAFSIPTLEEVLAAKNIPPYLNIELKNPSIFDGTLETAVSALVKKYQVEKRVLFSSFNPFSIYRLSHLLPDVPRALLASEENEPGNRFVLRKLWLAPYVNANALHLDQRYVTTEQVRKYKKRNIPVALWTVNNKEKAQSFLEAGALSIITDTLGEEISPNEASAEN